MVFILLFLVVSFQSGLYSIIISLEGTGMWHYYGKLLSAVGTPWVPKSMTLGENKLEIFPSGCGVVFDGDTMHAGAVYSADQCNIDIRTKSIKDKSFCKKDPKYDASNANTKYYNLRLHLEVQTKVRSKTGIAFSKTRCDVMKNIISEYESRKKTD